MLLRHCCRCCEVTIAELHIYQWEISKLIRPCTTSQTALVPKHGLLHTSLICKLLTTPPVHLQLATLLRSTHDPSIVSQTSTKKDSSSNLYIQVRRFVQQTLPPPLPHTMPQYQYPCQTQAQTLPRIPLNMEKKPPPRSLQILSLG